MRVASWESSAGALAAFLNTSTQCVMADLLTITMLGGEVIRYSGADQAVTINGNTFALGPTIERGTISLRVGIEVDTLDVKLAANASVQFNSVPLLSFIRAGGLDGARIMLERAYAPSWGSAWVGSLMLFSGAVAECYPTRYEAKLIVKSDTERLNVMVPRNVYQPGCLNTLFDSSCGLAVGSYTLTGTASSATDVTRTTFSAATSQVTGYYDLGVVKFTSGPNVGVLRTLRRCVVTASVGQFTTLAPWPFAVTAGDTLEVYPGCDKKMSTCSGKFSNLLRFRGHPFVPIPETVT
jgi:uncharacterized phage protein (TIGR02218 family)